MGHSGSSDARWFRLAYHAGRTTADEAMRMTVLRVALSGLWALGVCYPDPRVLWQAILNAWRPPIDGSAVQDWARTLPDDPAAIEQAVHQRVQYAVPWQTLGVPWAFPSPGQTVTAGRGDCQARAVVFASVLAAKGIPFQLRASLDHMWVEYRGKRPNVLENAAKTLWTRPLPTLAPGFLNPHGAVSPVGLTDQAAAGSPAIRFRFPAVDWAESWRIEREYFWDAAPLSRKALLALGLALIWTLRR